MFPAFSIECAALLARHNNDWEERLANWRRFATPPWWERDLIITPELRATYEMWLPVREFLHSLKAIGLKWLPSAACLPLPFRRKCYHSLPDLWAALPVNLEKKLCFSPQELLAFFCALADPPRFGTICGRYNEELTLISRLAHPNMRILDVACGVGLNTLEIAAASGAETIGISSEWLEVWMASNRCLPHDAAREQHMRRFPCNLNVCFQQGCAECFAFERPFDIIVCNGLVGGRFFHAEEQYSAFLVSCRNALAPQGTILLANHFHDGSRSDVERFMQLASQTGFSVEGTWHQMALEIYR
ncbi:MAG: class I SAM-dependent methyltransferase [Victivallales bacterium]|nr:class I SAM-dependent methyltransferase [Victivallales bacterium]